MTGCGVYGAPEGQYNFFYTLKIIQLNKKGCIGLAWFFCSTIEGGTPLTAWVVGGVSSIINPKGNFAKASLTQRME